MEIMKTVKFKNCSDHTLHIEAPVDEIVKPGECLDLPEHLVRPHRLANGGRAKSVIEMIAPQMKPADKAFADEWSKAPVALDNKPEKGKRAPTVAALVAAGAPRGVAEAIVAASKAKVAEDGK